MELSLALVAALALDAVIGDPRRGHPLAAFGRFAEYCEARCNRGRRRDGVLAVMVLIAPFVVVAWFMGALLPWPVGWVLAALGLMVAVGRTSLFQHANAVVRALSAGNLAAARCSVGRLVSRETGQLGADGVRAALLESVLENSSDAIFASLFWFALGGALAGPGGALAAVAAHRLTNTLDAMWGYRSARLAEFGWAAAKLDDVLNWPAARLTATLFAVLGDTRDALACWRSQAPSWSSPNAGPVMATGAGALGIFLGGKARYGGEWRERPVLGRGQVAGNADVVRALALIDRALAVFLIVVLLGDGLW